MEAGYALFLRSQLFSLQASYWMVSFMLCMKVEGKEGLVTNGVRR